MKLIYTIFLSIAIALLAIVTAITGTLGVWQGFSLVCLSVTMMWGSFAVWHIQIMRGDA